MGNIARACFVGFIAACAPNAGQLGSPDGGVPSWIGTSGDRMSPLPAENVGSSTRFVTHEQCAQCHVGSAPNVMLDQKGRDVSPTTTWRASMMALAVRDPFYLATFSQELAHRPKATAVVEQTCSVCHAPAAVTDAVNDGFSVTFASLTTGTARGDHLARDGVTCSLCHQIQPTGLGTFQSFTGKYAIGDARQIFGPFDGPATSPMQTFVSYTPMKGAQISESALCATCHTVITKTLDANGNPTGPSFVEQGAYLEWRSGDFNAEGTPGPRAATCQSCHVPTTDDDGQPISAVLSKVPQSGLSARTPIGRHLFVGGNVQMLSVMADQSAWTGSATPASELLDAANRAKASLASAVKLTITRAERTGVDVKVENQTGHKFPTGYPSRRAWIHFKATVSGKVVLESGRADDYGRIVDASGHAIDDRDTVRLHLDTIDSDGKAQIYELVPGDSTNRVARSLLDASTVLKDNRLLPAGYSSTSPYAPLINPVGTSGDANFGSSDTVAYVLSASSTVHVDVELLFQSVRPSELENLAAEPTPASRSFFDMLQKRATPIVIATASADVP
jgi:hypothetical protein